jgi:hypothetical protein
MKSRDDARASEKKQLNSFAPTSSVWMSFSVAMVRANLATDNKGRHQFEAVNDITGG